MSLFGRLRAGLHAVTYGPQESMDSGSGWFVRMLGGGKTNAGVQVSEWGALHYPAVYACMNRIGNPISLFPVGVFQKNSSGGSDPVSQHPMSDRIGLRPNDFMSSRTLRKTVQTHALSWGNGYVEIERNGAGQSVGLWPLLPWNTQPDHDQDARLIFRTTIAGQQHTLDGDNVIHVMDQSRDGYRGLSPIGLARQAIGMGLAMEEFGGKFFANDAKSGGFLMHPGRLGPNAMQNIGGSTASGGGRYREETVKRNPANPASRLDAQGGLDNAHRVKVLEEGMKFVPTTIPPEDAQFLGSRLFQIAEIARMYDVPLIMLQSHDGNTCLPADAVVATPTGPRRIADVSPGDFVWSVDQEMGGFVASRVWRSEKTGSDRILTIKTRGRELRANARHRVLARRKSPDPQPGTGGYRKIRWENMWVPAGELVVGDYIVAAAAFPVGDKRKAPNGRDLTVGFMEFAGLLIGDGNVVRRTGTGEGARVHIARHHAAAYMDHYRAVAKREFHRSVFGFGGSAAREKTGIRLQEYERSTVFSSKDAATELSDLGLSGTARTKRVPRWVFDLSPDLQLGFLRGYLDSDGACDSRGWITYSSCNFDLLEDVRHLCIGLGIPVGTVRTYHPVGEVVIAGRVTRRGTIHQLFLFDVPSNRRIGSNDPCCSDRLEKAPISSHRTNRYSEGYQGRGGSAASRPGTGFDLAGCVLHRVTSIEIGESEDVYDLGVERTENFVADGVVVHNSWGSGIEALMIGFVRQTISPWVNAWEQEFNWKLFTDDERERGLYVKFNMNAWLRGDSAGRAALYKALFEMAGITPNQICAYEDTNGFGPDGDKRFVSANVVALDQALNPPPPTGQNGGTPPADTASPAGDAAPEQEAA